MRKWKLATLRAIVWGGMGGCLFMAVALAASLWWKVWILTPAVELPRRFTLGIALLPGHVQFHTWVVSRDHVGGSPAPGVSVEPYASPFHARFFVIPTCFLSGPGAPVRYGKLTVPLWIPLVCVGGATLLPRRRLSPRPVNSCPCGYALDGLADAVPCPECGRRRA